METTNESHAGLTILKYVLVVWKVLCISLSLAIAGMLGAYIYICMTLSDGGSGSNCEIVTNLILFAAIIIGVVRIAVQLRITAYDCLSTLYVCSISVQFSMIVCYILSLIFYIIFVPLPVPGEYSSMDANIGVVPSIIMGCLFVVIAVFFTPWMIMVICTRTRRIAPILRTIAD